MGLYQGKAFPLKTVGTCSTCPNKTIAARQVSNTTANQWVPGTVRTTIDATGEEDFIKTTSVDMTFCSECIQAVDKSDFPHLEDTIWRGWRLAADRAQLSAKEWEDKVHQYRGFRLIGFQTTCKRVDAGWKWEDVDTEEARGRKPKAEIATA